MQWLVTAHKADAAAEDVPHFFFVGVNRQIRSCW